MLKGRMKQNSLACPHCGSDEEGILTTTTKRLRDNLDSVFLIAGGVCLILGFCLVFMTNLIVLGFVLIFIFMGCWICAGIIHERQKRQWQHEMDALDKELNRLLASGVKKLAAKKKEAA